MTDKELDELDGSVRCEHNWERIMAVGNKHTYGCICGATRTVRLKNAVCLTIDGKEIARAVISEIYRLKRDEGYTL